MQQTETMCCRARRCRSRELRGRRPQHRNDRMDFIVPAAAAFAGAALVYFLMRGSIDRDREALAATRDLLDKARVDMRDAVKAVAAEALHANNAAFLDLAKASFSGLHKDASHDLEARRKAIDGMIEPM